MNLDPVILSRIQFAFVIAFHFLLPAFTIGLASYIAVLEGLHLVTKKEVYLRISTFWIKLFAVAFGMGVVSGIVLPFQIGTNWSGYSDVTANVIAPLMTYEAMMAFFLEAGFLGVLLFGRKLVPPGCTLLPQPSSPSERSSARSGYSRRTAGCTRLPGLRSSMDASFPPTGWPSSSTPRSRIDCCIPSRRPTSRPHSR